MIKNSNNLFQTNARAIATLAMSLLVISCQSKLTVKTVDKPKAATPETTEPAPVASPVVAAKSEPVEMPGAATAARQYFQSRSSIGLRISLTGFAQNTNVSVTNSTSQKTLIADLNPDLDSQNTEYRYYNVGIHGDLTLFPVVGQTEAEFRNSKFVYGLNKISFLSEGPSESKISSIDIFLKDSPFFAQSTTFFDSGDQREGGFEGLFEAMPAAVLSNGKNLMIMGNIPVVTR